MSAPSSGLAFLGPATRSDYGEACLQSRKPFPIISFLIATAFAFLLGTAIGVLIMLRYQNFNPVAT